MSVEEVTQEHNAAESKLVCGTKPEVLPWDLCSGAAKLSQEVEVVYFSVLAL